MFTHTFYRSWGREGQTITKSIDVSAGKEVNIDEEIPAATADKLVAFNLDISQCKGLFMVSNVPVTIETNSSSAPANTFTLAANIPYAWVFGDSAMRDTAAAAVTVDITSLYVTNADAEDAALLQIRCLTDPTV